MFLPLDAEIGSLGESLLELQPEQIFEPGYATGYSNWTTALAGYIVEEVSGMTFAEYVHENIFQPLDMNDTALLPDLSDNPSVKERRDNLRVYRSTEEITDGGNRKISLYPAGMATGTLEDFRKFANEFLQGEEGLKLFNSYETFEEMLKPTKYYGDTDIGLNHHACGLGFMILRP